MSEVERVSEERVVVVVVVVVVVCNDEDAQGDDDDDDENKFYRPKRRLEVLHCWNFRYCWDCCCLLVRSFRY